MKSYYVNGKTIQIKSHQFTGTQSKEEYENQIYTALSKIGVYKTHIKINLTKEFCTLKWQINENEFTFSCNSQQTQTQNIGAIAQAIQEDVRQIMRGIKDLNLVMRQYSDQKADIKQAKSILDFSNSNNENEIENKENIKDNNNNNKIDEKNISESEKPETKTQNNPKNKNLLEINEENEKQKSLFSVESIKSQEPEIEQIEITSEIQARIIIDEIKEKYPNFRNYNLLPKHEKELFRKAHAYLGIFVNF